MAGHEPSERGAHPAERDQTAWSSPIAALHVTAPTLCSTNDFPGQGRRGSIYFRQDHITTLLPLHVLAVRSRSFRQRRGPHSLLWGSIRHIVTGLHLAKVSLLWSGFVCWLVRHITNPLHCPINPLTGLHLNVLVQAPQQAADPLTLPERSHPNFCWLWYVDCLLLTSAHIAVAS